MIDIITRILCSGNRPRDQPRDMGSRPPLVGRRRELALLGKRLAGQSRRAPGFPCVRVRRCSPSLLWWRLEAAQEVVHHR